MAAPMVGSALLRRYIGRQFARLRSQAGLSQEAAADALQRSRATIARIEEGDPRVRFRDIEVRAMLDLYHASDRDRATLLGLTAETRNGHRKGWWHDYTDTALPGWFELYVALEDSAEIIREYDIENVPGLLQTRAYAEQVMRSPANNLAPDEAAHRVQLRMQRQSLLTRPRAPRYEVILSEAALHRPVGGPAAMAEQLQRLIDVGSMPNVSISRTCGSASCTARRTPSGTPAKMTNRSALRSYEARSGSFRMSWTICAASTIPVTRSSAASRTMSAPA